MRMAGKAGRRVGTAGVAAGLALGGLGLSVAAFGGCQTKAQRWTQQSLDLGNLRAAGNAAFADGRYEEATEFYGRYLDIRPHEPDVQWRMGRALLALGRPAEAREHLRIAYDLVPSDGRYTESLAEAILRSGNREELIGFLRGSAESTLDARGYITLGRYAAEAGFPDEARAALLQAAAMEGSTSPEPHRALAAFYRSLNDTAAETRHLRAVLWFNSNDPQATARLREMDIVPGPTLALDPNSL
jgi:tetratricopeptide (TPR) repeat protein